ncbi:MAG TPA: hypothetical protein VIB79_09500 [Candidatus Binatia bacterium]|jgi:hypothetical protein
MMKPGYSEILRVIGDDLERRGLKAFDLQRRGERYILHCGYQSPPAVTPLVLEYGDTDIEEMRLAGIESRAERPRNLDFSTLTQLLRTIGTYLDQRRASLHKLTNNEFSGGDPVFRLDYETDEGEFLSEQRCTAELYDLGVRLYKKRSADGKTKSRFATGGRPPIPRSTRQAASGERDGR